MASTTSFLSLSLPTGYPFVLLAATSSVFLTTWQGILVSMARKQSGLKYPYIYHDKAEATANPKANVMNCTQRAHQNTLEVIPGFLLTTLVAGLKYPRAAAGLGALWVVGRIFYTLGYSTGDPSKRGAGAIPSSLALISLIIAATSSAVLLAKESGWKI